MSLILLISFADKAFSQTEQITITTYYPAPYGVYRVLRTDILQMGQAAGVVQFVDLAMAQAVGVNPTANAFQFGSFGLDPAGNLSGDGDDDVGLADLIECVRELVVLLAFLLADRVEKRVPDFRRDIERLTGLRLFEAIGHFYVPMPRPAKLPYS